ncbi:hypothetical protein, partial [Helicobacter sp. CLO-3]|uniref:hypothetical protein n=1 Tax=Helicobacter sp. CLO-3 TaxID=211 RepID=UPI0012E92428
MTMRNLKLLKTLQNARATQNPKTLNLKTLKSKISNLKMFKKLALACLFALMLDSSLQANTNPLTDTSKHIYHPQT